MTTKKKRGKTALWSIIKRENEKEKRKKKRHLNRNSFLFFPNRPFRSLHFKVMSYRGHAGRDDPR